MDTDLVEKGQEGVISEDENTKQLSNKILFYVYKKMNNNQGQVVNVQTLNYGLQVNNFQDEIFKLL